MKILVTGASGRIGAHAVRQLLEAGAVVHGVDTQIQSGNLRSLVNEFQLSKLDVLDQGALTRQMLTHRYTHVVHLAAAIGAHYDDHPYMSFAVNLGGTVNVLEAARAAGVGRVVMASTHSIYPVAAGVHDAPDWRPITEDHPPQPTRTYAVMKLASEHLGAVYSSRYGIEFAAIRFASYYSAERAVRPGTSVSDVLNWLINGAVVGVPTHIPKGGDQVFDPVYAKDCANGIVCAVKAQSPLHGRVFNVGGGRPVTLFDAAAAVRAVVPQADIAIGGGFGFAPASSEAGHYPWLDISRARTEIGYEPRFDLDAGVRDCIRELEALLK